MPDPVLGTGEVVVDVAAALVASYAANVFNGSRNYLLELPLIPGPGGIGRVRAARPDATRLIRGDRVFVDSTIRARGNIASPGQILRGFFFFDSRRERTLYPCRTEAANRFGEIPTTRVKAVLNALGD